MKKLGFVIGLVLCLILAGVGVVAAAPLDPQSPFIPYDYAVLPNGLRVIVKEIPGYPIVSVNMWVGAGGRYDPQDHSGLAHFFEHLLFKGTTSRPVGQIAAQVESLGGYINAMTGLDYTSYFVVVPSQYGKLAMEIQADAIMNSTFDQTEIDRERNVIHEEIRISHDQPSNRLLQMALDELFDNTPYSRPVLGTVEDLGNVNREQMLDFHARYYVPNNLVLVVAGDVDAQEILAHARDLYAGMVPRTIQRQPYFPTPKLTEVVRVDEERDLGQGYVFMAYPGPGVSHKDAAVLSLIGTILGGGRASRLSQLLLEENTLVNSVSSAYYEFQDIGIFGINAGLSMENQGEVEKLIKEEVRRLQSEPVSEEELQRARAMARSSFAFSAESNSNVTLILGMYEIFGGINRAVNTISVLEGITADDIMRVANEYLDPECYVWSQLSPRGGMN